jgi:hypothetical protein
MWTLHEKFTYIGAFNDLACIEPNNFIKKNKKQKKGSSVYIPDIREMLFES